MKLQWKQMWRRLHRQLKPRPQHLLRLLLLPRPLHRRHPPRLRLPLSPRRLLHPLLPQHLLRRKRLQHLLRRKLPPFPKFPPRPPRP